MELEALLLGIEPVAALGLGLAVIGLGAAISLLSNTEADQPNLAKHGPKRGIDAFEKVQGNIAEVQVSRNSKTPPEPK